MTKSTRRRFVTGSLAAGLASATGAPAAAPNLQGAFRNPPDSARPWTFWSWKHGYATRDSIVEDLEDMRRRGIGGIVLGYGGGPVSTPTPDDKPFMGPEWTELLRFAVGEAEKRGIEFGMYICSGWNVGGPWVKPEHAAQALVFSEARVKGGRSYAGVLAEPKHAEPYYRDIAVLAFRVEGPGKEGGRLCFSKTMVDLSKSMEPSGKLEWRAPEGEWTMLRFGHTIAPKGKTKWSAPGSGGYEVDPFQAEAMDAHFAATVDKLAAAGRGPRYLFVDSWETGKPNWTARMREEFHRRRGYDPLPYLPVLARKIVDSPEATARFEEDFDHTLGDLTVENHYGRAAERAHRHGIRVMMQAAGYQKPCVDSLRAMGRNDLPTGEFWARIYEPDGYLHQRSPAQLRFHDSIKLAASAAHIYGRAGVPAEAYTVWNPFWKPLDKDPFAFKDVGDHAFCQGLTNHLFIGYHNRPPSADKPPVTAAHFGRHVTWWPMSHAWMEYLTRCQFLLRQGCFVADVCYFYGDEVPNYVPSRDAMAPPLPRGYDCDSMNAEVLLSRLSVHEGRLRLPDGVSYRYLVMPHRTWSPPPGKIFNSKEDAFPGPGNGLRVAVSAASLRKIRELVEYGATLVGPPPQRAPGFANDAEVAALAKLMWGSLDAPAGERKLGRGRIVWGKGLDEIFAAAGLPPDFDFQGGRKDTNVEYIHRRIGGGDCYFISNQLPREEELECAFRVSGMQPELWDPVTGECRDLPEFRSEAGRTVVPLVLAPKQSFFVLFRKPAGKPAGRAEKNFATAVVVGALDGAWHVAFDPKSRGPAKEVVFQALEDWTKRPEEAIRYFSGTARYRKSFDFPRRGTAGRIYLDLGNIRNLAALRLNGKDLGVLWCAPWRVEITTAVRPRGNELEIDVVNLWPNRLIGDSRLPPEERPTNTLVYKPDFMLLPSGLMGPVTLRVTPAARPAV